MKSFTTYVIVAFATLGLFVLLFLPGIQAAIYQRSTEEIILGFGYRLLSLGLGAGATWFWQRYPLKRWQVFLAYCIGTIPLFIIAWGIETMWSIGPSAYGGFAGLYCLGVVLMRTLTTKDRSASPN
jgi:hypothetical protein